MSINGRHLDLTPPSKNDFQCEEDNNMKEGLPPSQPPNYRPMDDHICAMIKELHLEESHVKQIFEFRSDFANLNYKMEQLNPKVNLFMALCSHLMQHQHVEDMAT
jgi:hypothetical protein